MGVVAEGKAKAKDNGFLQRDIVVLDHYDEVPNQIQQKIIEEHRAAKGQEETG